MANLFGVMQRCTSVLSDISADRHRVKASDVLCVAALIGIVLALTVLRFDAVAMQTWDEARLANNALEIARSGHWLIPTYGGVPDHWNTKPPLLIWAMACLLRLGLPPLMAVRLPSILATLATTILVWGFCRFGLQDRVAATVAGFLLVASTLYTGVHVGRTGDYDALESFFITVYVLAFWRAFYEDEAVHAGWMAVWGGAVVLATMTKGVAGVLPLPGLFVFALLGGRWRLLVRDARFWVAGLSVAAICAGYYGSRELYDPGYVRAMWNIEIRGRYLQALDAHRGGFLFYPFMLVKKFEPGLILLPLATLPLLALDRRRRSLVLICMLSAGALLAVLMSAKTQLYWYAAPAVPLLSVASAVGVSDGMRWVASMGHRLPCFFRVVPMRVALVILLLLGVLGCLYLNQVRFPEQARHFENAQFYGQFLKRLQMMNAAPSVVIVDNGVLNNAGFKAYNPILKFYAGIAEEHGMSVSVVEPGFRLPSGTLTASCDPKSLLWLRNRYEFIVRRSDAWCAFGQIGNSLNPSADHLSHVLH